MKMTGFLAPLEMTGLSMVLAKEGVGGGFTATYLP